MARLTLVDDILAILGVIGTETLPALDRLRAFSV
jgi:hypothetical protein